MKHLSDCATHNEPALPAGPCDCDTPERRLAEEIERQRAIYRLGTPEHVLRRAAVAALMDRGER